VAVLAAAGAVTAMLAIGSSRAGNASGELDAAPAAQVARASAGSSAPAAQVAPASAGSSAPAGPPPTVAVHVESSPEGAEVFRWPSELKVGVTPWDGALPRADGVAVFMVKKRGYADQRIELDLRSDARTRVTLPRVPAVHVRPPGPAAEPRHKGEPADPFKGGLR
jgi:hypothetical protein